MTTSVLIDEILYKKHQAKSVFKEMAILLSGVGLIAALAQVVIPLVPVPITGQTLGVLIIGASFGAKRSFFTMLAYLGFGALGLPFFAEGSSGWSVLVGPTAGYLIGMWVASYVMGRLSSRGQDRSIIKALPLFLMGHAIIFAFGITWLALQMNFQTALQVGLTPFIPGLCLKTAVAAAVMPAAWKLIKT